jgi:hypothetical protein
MSFIKDLINPPPVKGNLSDHYKFFNSVHQTLSALTSVRNPTVLLDSNFAELSAKGLNPTTPADGDNTEFIKNWFVVGATAASYTITPTAYAANATIKSSSLYYVHNVVTAHNGQPFYFYQKQLATVRQYQQDYLTYGLLIKNNQSKAIKLRMDIYMFYDPTFSLKKGSTFFLQPGLNNLTSTIQTDSLTGITVGAGNYTEFRFNFIDLINGAADIELYQIKCEFGQVSTPL